MLKQLLICMILMHITLETQVASQDYGNKDQYKKHKKYIEDDQQKYHKDGGYYKDDDIRKDRYYDNRDGHEFKKYRDDEYRKEKTYDRRDENRDRQRRHDDGGAYVVERPSNYARDMDVNSDMTHRYQDPQSESLTSRKTAFYQNMKKIDLSTPPNPNDFVLMARYIVHNVDWAAMATLSSRQNSRSNPFANILSMSDGPVEKGSGIPFFYITPIDMSTQDIMRENKASITVTLAQTNYCKTSKLDAQDPRCARVILSGKVKRIRPDSIEDEFARKAMFSRHPVMESWPKDHDFFLAKMKIAQIVLLDQFGGAKEINVLDYLGADTSSKPSV